MLVILLMTIASVTFAHFHTDRTGQGCGLCNVRHQVLLTSPVSDGPAAPIETEFTWVPEESSYEPEIRISGKSSRAPPQSIAFAV